MADIKVTRLIGEDFTIDTLDCETTYTSSLKRDIMYHLKFEDPVIEPAFWVQYPQEVPQFKLFFNKLYMPGWKTLAEQGVKHNSIIEMRTYTPQVGRTQAMGRAKRAEEGGRRIPKSKWKIVLENMLGNKLQITNDKVDNVDRSVERVGNKVDKAMSFLKGGEGVSEDDLQNSEIRIKQGLMTNMKARNDERAASIKQEEALGMCRDLGVSADAMPPGVTASELKKVHDAQKNQLEVTQKIQRKQQKANEKKELAHLKDEGKAKLAAEKKERARLKAEQKAELARLTAEEKAARTAENALGSETDAALADIGNSPKRSMTGGLDKKSEKAKLGAGDEAGGTTPAEGKLARSAEPQQPIGRRLRHKTNLQCPNFKTDGATPPSPTELHLVIDWPHEVFAKREEWDPGSDEEEEEEELEWHEQSASYKREVECISAQQVCALRKFMFETGGTVQDFKLLDLERKHEFVSRDGAADLAHLESLDPGWLPWRREPMDLA